jgi:hypothetical protein
MGLSSQDIFFDQIAINGSGAQAGATCSAFVERTKPALLNLVVKYAGFGVGNLCRFYD